ncbi:MAG: sigma 54-interacting transcriptional regulator [Polyangiaceae bacterium]
MVFLVREDVSPFLGSVDPRDPRLVGGPSLAEVRRRIDLAKGSPLAVLVEGETGAGKEVVAGCIHAASGRTGELVEVNCAAIPPELVESELFGHARGAFSGSDRARTGLFRTADGGTLLLDEIGELPGALQAKLLRVLETGEVRPVGEDRAVTVDVRVIAATNRSLDELASRGAFREDLLYRVAALRIAVPPLRDRLEDLPALTLHFLAGSGVDIAPRAMEVLLRHRWPGNARQLRNLLAAAVATTRAAGRKVIGAGDVSALLATASVGEQDDGRAHPRRAGQRRRQRDPGGARPRRGALRALRDAAPPGRRPVGVPAGARRTRFGVAEQRPAERAGERRRRLRRVRAELGDVRPHAPLRRSRWRPQRGAVARGRETQRSAVARGGQDSAAQSRAGARRSAAAGARPRQRPPPAPLAPTAASSASRRASAGWSSAKRRACWRASSCLPRR